MMLYKNKKSRSAIPGYTLIPNGDHYKVRKIGITGDKVKNDPAYRLTRLHNEAFKKAAGLGKLIRNSLLLGTGIKNKPTALTAALLKVLAANDAPLHERSFATACFESMDGFNLNDNAAWSDCTNLNIDTLYIACYRTAKVFLPGFLPSGAIKAPEAITHARITITTVFIDTHDKEIETHEEKTTILPLKGMVVSPVTLIANSNSITTGIWLVAMGITWYQPGKKDSQLTVSKVRGPLTIVKMGAI